MNWWKSLCFSVTHLQPSKHFSALHQLCYKQNFIKRFLTCQTSNQTSEQQLNSFEPSDTGSSAAQIEPPSHLCTGSVSKHSYPVTTSSNQKKCGENTAPFFLFNLIWVYLNTKQTHLTMTFIFLASPEHQRIYMDRYNPSKQQSERKTWILILKLIFKYFSAE